jgi:hypothetical protein
VPLSSLAIALPPELDNKEEEHKEAPDPSREIWPPTPACHGGILYTTPTSTAYTTAAGTLPQPPPDGIAVGEGLSLAQGERDDSQGESGEESSREGKNGRSRSVAYVTQWKWYNTYLSLAVFV